MFYTWPILQICLQLLLALIIITQLILPAFINRPLFWFFRKADRQNRKAHGILGETETEEDTFKTKKEINKKEIKWKEKI